MEKTYNLEFIKAEIDIISDALKHYGDSVQREKGRIEVIQKLFKQAVEGQEVEV